jgi:VWFA-related protein
VFSPKKLCDDLHNADPFSLATVCSVRLVPSLHGLLALSALLLPLPGWAQPARPAATPAPTPALAFPPGPAPTAEEAARLGYGETFSVEFVLVRVAIRGGEAGERLAKERFMVKVDGKPVPIETFESEMSAPLSLVFLQDLSGSMAEPGKMEASHEALDCFLDTANRDDERALATFASGRVQFDVPLTSDSIVLREAAELWQPWGTTGLYDAVATLPELTMGATGAKRAAVLVTDGIDNASNMTPAEAAALVQGAELPIYVLALPSHEAEADPTGTVRFADLLHDLAEQTGGQYHSITGPLDARRACSVILRDLRFQYVLGFSVTGRGPSTWRRIDVDVERPGRRTTLVHRRGYRGTAPSATSRPAS